ncbi:hypothetical protein NDU88_002891 [Pleurodeles waltl]|uniref:4Fe-4S ferredoxin-type domain-containing protein n=1 Tax=Pleurodeles waltl TaxID=8319 RepID=A0AAV7T3M6_PLEWA|nr:hypothetical protein NDU88_002891 [Pleurodeles waltl]
MFKIPLYSTCMQQNPFESDLSSSQALRLCAYCGRVLNVCPTGALCRPHSSSPYRPTFEMEIPKREARIKPPRLVEQTKGPSPAKRHSDAPGMGGGELWPCSSRWVRKAGLSAEDLVVNQRQGVGR